MSLWEYPRNPQITVASVLEVRLLELLPAPLHSVIFQLQVYFLLFINLPQSLMLEFFSKIIGVSCLSHLNVTTEWKTMPSLLGLSRTVLCGLSRSPRCMLGSFAGQGNSEAP